MGLINTVMSGVFGGGSARDLVEVFRENAEKGAIRDHDLGMSVLSQYAAEFRQTDRSGFDRFIDGVNRIPRPAMALGVLALFLSAMVDPIWFAARMQGLAVVPDPLWWLLGAIVAFYFGGRHQAKGQAFQKDLAASMSRVPQALDNLDRLDAMRRDRDLGHAPPDELDPLFEQVESQAEPDPNRDVFASERVQGLRDRLSRARAGA